jgi:hypothetical protein
LVKLREQSNGCNPTPLQIIPKGNSRKGCKICYVTLDLHVPVTFCQGTVERVQDLLRVQICVSLNVPSIQQLMKNSTFIRRNWQDLARMCGKIWQDLARFGKIWQDLARFGKIWQEDLARFGKIVFPLFISIWFVFM